jgi:hypothetical protein
MPTTVVVPILALLWIVVLAPGIVRRVREYKSVEGIDSFHASLHVLQHHGAHAPGFAHVSPRPQLVLLHPVDNRDASADAYIDELSGECFNRVPIEHEPLPAYEPLRPRGRSAQAKRRRSVLVSLLGGTLLGLGGGAVSGSAPLLVLGVLSLICLVAFIAAAVAIVSRPAVSPRRTVAERSDFSDFSEVRRYATGR